MILYALNVIERYLNLWFPIIEPSMFEEVMNLAFINEMNEQSEEEDIIEKENIMDKEMEEDD